MKAVVAALSSLRYHELEKEIQKEGDPARRAQLERDLLRAQRYGRI